MNAEELDEQLRASNAPLQELEREHEEIMASVQARLEANRAAREVAREERKKKAEELWLQVTHEDLCDPLKFQLISEMAWDAVGGDASSTHLKEVLFPDTYVQKDLSWWGYKNPLMTFGVSIPKQSHPEKLARTAELLAPVLKAATANDEHAARISIMEDDCGYHVSWHIVWDEEENLFMLQGGRSYESEDLLAVLKQAPTYY